MNEISFTVTAFEQGGVDSNGEPTTSSYFVRSNMIEIPSGIQKITSVPEIWKKQWDSENESYEITQSTFSSIGNKISFYKADGETFEYLGYSSAKNEVDFMAVKCLGATHIRFTASISSYTMLHPDDSAETKKHYYFIDSINVNGTILKWYYSNDRLTHDDMTPATEKAMKKPYPHALWRIDGISPNMPYHELFPIEKPSGAFMNAVNLEYVHIPESVRKIGRYAFFNTVLRKVRISSECEYYETSFPEECTIEFYEKNGIEAVSGQTYDSDGHILIDADGARIYTER